MLVPAAVPSFVPLMPRHPYITNGRRAGLGALNNATGQAALGLAPSIVPIIAGAVSSSATIAGATGLAPMLAAIGVSGPAAPFVAAAIAVALPVFKLIKSMAAGCGETCIATSNWANQAEAALVDVNRQYFAQPTRTKQSQVYALQLVEELFRQLRELCSNPQTGAAGQRCISERLVRGGTAPWCPKPGHTGCDWYALYYDPIATDAAAVAGSDPVSSLLSLDGSSLSKYAVPLMLAAGAGALFIWGDK